MKLPVRQVKVPVEGAIEVRSRGIEQKVIETSSRAVEKAVEDGIEIIRGEANLLL